MQLLTSSSVQGQAMLNGFNLVCDVQQYWKICEDNYLQSANRLEGPELLQRLANLYSEIIEYQARVICHLSRPQRSRAWQGVVASIDWDSKACQVDVLSKQCKEYMTHDQGKRVAELLDNQLAAVRSSCKVEEKILEALVQGRQDDLERRLLELLASATSNYEADKNFNSLRFKGSCEWFFVNTRFCTWRASDVSSLLWVSAEPGWGKSVLSRSLIEDHLASDTTTVTASQSAITVSTESPTVCYFFFKDGDERRTTSTSALCAILHQLFSRDSTGALMKLAFDIHKNKGSTLQANFAALWGILMACIQAPECGEVICVLDALDECDKTGQKELFGELQKFYSQERQPGASKLKFLITSRPYDTLEASFRKFSGSSAYLRFDGDDNIEDVCKDINEFIDRRVHELPSNISSQDRHRISEQLKSTNNRTYLWIQLVFNIIEEDPSEYCRPGDIEHILLNLPPQVAGAYEKILNKSKDSRTTKALLQIVLAASRPLRLVEANYALTLALRSEKFASHEDLQQQLWNSEDFINVVRSSCGLVISVYRSELSFIHQTAREFLIAEPDPTTKWKGRFNSLADCHRKLSQSCIEYLQLFPNDHDPSEPPWSRFDVFGSGYPLIRYASTYWTVHYAAQDPAAQDESRKNAWMLFDFSQRRTEVWCQAYRVWSMRNSYSGWRGLAHRRQDRTALEMASFFGLLDIVADALSGEGMDGHVQQEKEYMALRAATLGGQRHVIQWFLDKLADFIADCNTYRLPLCEAAEYGDCEMMQMFLRLGNMAMITDDVITCAAKNTESAKEMMSLLLRERGDEVSITPQLLTVAVAGRRDAIEMAELLFEKSRNKLQVTEEVLIAMAENMFCGIEPMTWLLEKHGGEVRITEKIVKAAAANMAVGDKLIVLLLCERGDEVRVTEDVLKTAAENSARGYEIMKLIHEMRWDELLVTDVILKAAAGNAFEGHKITKFLLESSRSGVLLNEDLLVHAARYGNPDTMDLLLTLLQDESQFTERVVEAAAGSPWGGQKLGLLLKSHGGRVKITTRVVEAAAANPVKGVDVMALLLEERGAEFKVTTEVLRAVRGSDYTRGRVAAQEFGRNIMYAKYDTAEEIMALLLRERGDEVKGVLPELSQEEREWVERCWSREYDGCGRKGGGRRQGRHWRR